MKAAILVESLTGHTWKAGELIAAQLQQAGWGITALSPVRQPDYAGLQAAALSVHRRPSIQGAELRFSVRAIPARARNRDQTSRDTMLVNHVKAAEERDIPGLGRVKAILVSTRLKKGN